MMDTPNQIHVSIDYLQDIVDGARRMHKENPNGTVPIIRITKTGWRQVHEAQDKVECKLLTSCTITENIEG